MYKEVVQLLYLQANVQLWMPEIPSYDNIVIQDAGLNHKLVKIYKNGRVFAAHYAEPWPTKRSAMADYKANPKSFEPYDESTGRYLK